MKKQEQARRDPGQRREGPRGRGRLPQGPGREAQLRPRVDQHGVRKIVFFLSFFSKLDEKNPKMLKKKTSSKKKKKKTQNTKTGSPRPTSATTSPLRATTPAPWPSTRAPRACGATCGRAWRAPGGQTCSRRRTPRTPRRSSGRCRFDEHVFSFPFSPLLFSLSPACARAPVPLSRFICFFSTQVYKTESINQTKRRISSFAFSLFFSPPPPSPFRLSSFLSSSTRSCLFFSCTLQEHNRNDKKNTLSLTAFSLFLSQQTDCVKSNNNNKTHKKGKEEVKNSLLSTSTFPRARPGFSRPTSPRRL